MTYRDHSDACHLWTLALLDCAADGRLMCYLPAFVQSLLCLTH